MGSAAHLFCNPTKAMCKKEGKIFNFALLNRNYDLNNIVNDCQHIKITVVLCIYTLMFKTKVILLKMDTLNRFKVTAFTKLLNIYFSNKCYSFEL